MIENNKELGIDQLSIRSKSTSKRVLGLPYLAPTKIISIL